MALPAAAVTVTVDGTTYDLSVSVTDYPTDAILLESQQWWGNSDLANSIASAYMASGSANLLADFGVKNVIYFAYSAYFDGVDNVVGVTYYHEGDQEVDTTLASYGSVNNYVVATSVSGPSSVPEINAGALSQVFLILFALWLVVRRREASTSV